LITNKIKNLTFLRLPINEKINFINFSFAVLFLFFLPLNQKLLPPLIVLWILSFIVEVVFFKNKRERLEKERKILLIIPVLFFLSNAVGFFYSNNKTASFLNIQTTLSLFIFPLIFIFSNELYKKNGKVLLSVFVIGNVVAAIICLVLSFSNSINFIDGKIIFNTAIRPEFANKSFFYQVTIRVSEFSYMYLSRFIHPSYFALYLNIGIVILYYLYRQALNNKEKIVYIIGIVFFYSIIYLLASRAGLLSLFVTLIVLTIIELKLNKHYILILLFSFTLNFGLYKAMTQGQIKTNITQVQQEIKKIHQKQETKNIEQEQKQKPVIQKEQQDARLIIWKYALLAIKENVIFGVGNGDMRNTMCEKYIESGYEDGLELKLDPHNQYLTTMLSGGIFSLILLLLMLGWGFLYSIKTKRYVFSFFIAIFSFNILVESMLTTIAGVAFFAFFFSFLTIYTPTCFKKTK
jgi:hypothetical protein